MRQSAAVMSGLLLVALSSIAASTESSASQQGEATRRYAPVNEGERRDRVELVEDLVLGGADDARETTMFYRVAAIAVDGRGRIFVAEELGQRVRVFDAEGEFLREFGRRGEGPGDFQRPLGIAVVRDTVVVEDRNNARFSLWSVDGEHLSDRRVEPYPPRVIAGTDVGLVICVRWDTAQQAGHGRLVAFDLSGNPVREYFNLPYDRTPSVEYRGVGMYDLDGIIPRARPSFAVAHDGRVYGAAGDAYEVEAKGPDGSVLQTLRVDTPPVPFEPTREQTRSIVDEWSAFTRDGARPSDINWPELEPVIERIDVDGLGNLYVYPWVHPLELQAERAVDVYSAGGERVFAGYIRNVDWDAALGEHVYAVDEDPVTGEQRVVRYRMALPWRSGRTQMEEGS